MSKWQSKLRFIFLGLGALTDNAIVFLTKKIKQIKFKLVFKFILLIIDKYICLFVYFSSSFAHFGVRGFIAAFLSGLANSFLTELRPAKSFHNSDRHEKTKRR